MAGEVDGAGGSPGAVPQTVVYVALAALVALTALMALWDYLTTLYLVALVAWLAVAAGLAGTDLFRRLASMDVLRLTMVVFAVAVAVRWLMLFQGEVITRDITMFVQRGQLYLDGAVPYSSELSVNKPPAYLYLASGLAASVGPWEVGFRAVMSLADSLVAVMLLWMGRERFSVGAGAFAGMVYALNPISAVSVGLSGHYDPLVVLFALGGVWLALRGRHGWASLAMGAGFALKLYPAVLLPWVLHRERSWKRRVLYAAVFAVPMALSWLPVLAQNGDALADYASWQGGWIPKKGIAWGAAMAMGWTREGAAAGLLGDAVEYVFLGLLVVMFLDWVRRGRVVPRAHLNLWFRVVTASYYVLYGFIFVGSVMDYRFDLGQPYWLLGAMVAGVYFPLGAIGLWWLWTRYLQPPPRFSPDERFIMLSAMSVALLLFSSAQYNPWYLLWLLPLVLLVQVARVRDAWNALLVWNVEGLGIEIWPGVGFHPPPSS